MVATWLLSSDKCDAVALGDAETDQDELRPFARSIRSSPNSLNLRMSLRLRRLHRIVLENFVDIIKVRQDNLCGNSLWSCTCRFRGAF
jgi:hypothetical protein